MRCTAMMKCWESGPFSITSRRRSRLNRFGICSSIFAPASPRSRYWWRKAMPKLMMAARRVMDVLVKLLGPQPHPGAAVRILRRQPRLRIGVFEIFQDDVRFRHHLVAVDQRRHHRAAVELEIPGLLVLAVAQHEVAVLPWRGPSRRGTPSPSGRRATCRCDRAPASVSPVFTTVRHGSSTGAHITWSIRVAPVASITSRSKPSATPQAGGIARSAAMKSSSIG